MKFLVTNTSNFLPTKARRARKTKTKKVLDADVKGVVVAMIFLQRVLMPTPLRKMRETSPKSSALPTIQRDITQTYVPRI